MAEKQLNITIWNEYRHERQEPAWTSTRTASTDASSPSLRPIRL